MRLGVSGWELSTGTGWTVRVLTRGPLARIQLAEQVQNRSLHQAQEHRLDVLQSNLVPIS